MDDVVGCLALDAMGGDMGPLEFVEGVKLALNSDKNDSFQEPILLVGRESELTEALGKVGLSGDPRVKIIHAEQVVDMEDKPMDALKKKKQSSMMVALDLVKEGAAKAILSTGNTGSLMGGGTIKLRPLEGVERPALATIIPGRDRYRVLIDGGANPESTPTHIAHNAVLGSNFAKIVLGIDMPKVGLLTIGTEEGKGTEKIAETHHLLKAAQGVIDYHGLVEGFHVFDGDADVIVCDGFVGNVVIKACESLFHAIGSFLKKELNANPIRQSGALLCKGAFKNMKAHFNPSEYGGAPFLGLKAPVFKAHGSSDRYAIEGAIKIAMRVVKHDMTEHILEDIREINKATQPEAIASEI